MNFVIIKRFDNLYEAYIVKSKLESENIACYVFDDNLVGLNPLYNITVGGVKVKVNDYDFEDAEKILNESFNSVLTTDSGKTVQCPSCGSDQIYSGFKSMKSTKGIISTILSFIFMILPIYFKTVYRCKSCDNEFKKQDLS